MNSLLVKIQNTTALTICKTIFPKQRVTRIIIELFVLDGLNHASVTHKMWFTDIKHTI